MELEPNQLAEIMEKHGFDASPISVLVEIRARYRDLPREALTGVSQLLGTPLAQVHSVATRCSASSLKPCGKNTANAYSTLRAACPTWAGLAPQARRQGCRLPPRRAVRISHETMGSDNGCRQSVLDI